MDGRSLKYDFYTKKKLESEFLKDLGFSQDFIQENLDEYKISIEKIIFDLLDLEYKSEYLNHHIFILEEDVIRLYDYSHTSDQTNDLKIIETITQSAISKSFPVILIYIDSYMFYDEIYSYNDVEDEYFDDYFLKYIKEKLAIYFENETTDFKGINSFLIKIIHSFIGFITLEEEIEYSEIKEAINFAIEESLGL